MTETSNNNVRRDMVEKLKKEFDLMHDEIMNASNPKNHEQICELIKTQISLSMQIVREERDVNGVGGAYAFPSYTPR